MDHLSSIPLSFREDPTVSDWYVPRDNILVDKTHRSRSSIFHWYCWLHMPSDIPFLSRGRHRHVPYHWYCPSQSVSFDTLVISLASVVPYFRPPLRSHPNLVRSVHY